MKSVKKFFQRLFGKKKKKPDSSIYPMF